MLDMPRASLLAKVLAAVLAREAGELLRSLEQRRAVLRVVRRRPLVNSIWCLFELSLGDGREHPAARLLLSLICGETEALHLSLRHTLLRQVFLFAL